MIQPNIAKLSTVALVLLILPVTSFAGREIKSVEKVHESSISGSFGLDIVSQFIPRGIPVENQGAILQPFLELAFRVYEGEGGLSKMTVDLAFWNSFHSRGTGASAGSTTSKWFEADFVAGLSFYLGEDVVLSPYYHAYLSPNDAFETAHAIGLRLAYNVHGILGGWTLSPYVLAQRDVEGTSGNGGSSGWYYEVGISPGHQFGPIALTIPIKGGFGSDGYYAGDESFGFVSAGVNLTCALPFMPESLGDWSVLGYGTYYHLGEGTKAASVPDVRDSDKDEWVFGGGLRVNF